MSILGFIGGLIKPVTNLIDNLHTSDEEKGILHNELARIEQQFTTKMIEYETELLKAQSQIIQSETTGKSWLQRTWRPITMLTFLVLVICDQFGLLAFRLAPEAWVLLQIGLGGYVAGRSLEKWQSIKNGNNNKKE